MDETGTQSDFIFNLTLSETDGLKAIGVNQTSDNSISQKDVSIDLQSLKSLLNNGSTLYKTIDILKISVLNLSGCVINEIPDVFKKLPLKELYLSKVGLKTIPLCLYSGLKGLEILDLSRNEIKDFDIEPQCHSSLKSLFLNNNKLNDLPRWILALRAFSLEEFDYSNNRINKLKCIFKNHSFKFRVLRMRNCCLRDVDLLFFKNLEVLEVLDISNTPLEVVNSNILEELDELFVKVKWKNMRILNFNNLSLSVVPEGIVWLESLSELYLQNNNLSWLPNGMEYLVNLEIIDVSNNELTYIPTSFFLLRYIRIIKASNNHLCDFQDVAPMKYLEILDLYHNNLEDFDNIPSNIKMIDLEMNYIETKDCSFHDAYSNKLYSYRKTLSEKRHSGARPRPAIYYSTSESSASSDTSMPQDILEISMGESVLDEENWDEPYRPAGEKHPDVTLSDDEWDGVIDLPPSTPPLALNLNSKVYNDDWIFCDAEEEGS